MNRNVGEDWNTNEETKQVDKDMFYPFTRFRHYKALKVIQLLLEIVILCIISGGIIFYLSKFIWYYSDNFLSFWGAYGIITAMLLAVKGFTSASYCFEDLMAIFKKCYLLNSKFHHGIRKALDIMSLLTLCSFVLINGILCILFTIYILKNDFDFLGLLLQIIILLIEIIAIFNVKEASINVASNDDK